MIKQSVTHARMQMNGNQWYSLTNTRARPESATGMVLAFDTQWRCDSHREMYERIIGELAYDPADVYEMRITEAAVEVDFVDFAHPAWPLRTRRHCSPDTA